MVCGVIALLATSAFALDEKSVSVTKKGIGKSEVVTEEVTREKVIHGSVVAIEADRGVIVVKDDATGTDRRVAASQEAIAPLKVGERVRVATVTDVTATSVTRIAEEAKSADAMK